MSPNDLLLKKSNLMLKDWYKKMKYHVIIHKVISYEHIIHSVSYRIFAVIQIIKNTKLW